MTRPRAVFADLAGASPCAVPLVDRIAIAGSGGQGYYSCGMTPQQKQDFSRAKLRASIAGAEGAVIWSAHAVSRLIRSRWDRLQVERALVDGDLIEDYPEDHRVLPDCLLLGFSPDGDPIHAVFALDEKLDRLLVVTIYEPHPGRWDDDWRTRRS